MKKAKQMKLWDRSEGKNASTNHHHSFEEAKAAAEKVAYSARAQIKPFILKF